RSVRRGGRRAGGRRQGARGRRVRGRQQPGHGIRVQRLRAAPSALVSRRAHRHRDIPVVWSRCSTGDVLHQLRWRGRRVLHRTARRHHPRPLPRPDRLVILALKWGAPVAVVAACVGYLIYSASGGSAEYYLTVSELRHHAQTGDVRVAGVVQDDVHRTDGGLHVTFTEKDASAAIPVEYTGTLPDIFRP